MNQPRSYLRCWLPVPLASWDPGTTIKLPSSIACSTTLCNCSSLCSRFPISQGHSNACCAWSTLSAKQAPRAVRMRITRAVQQRSNRAKQQIKTQKSTAWPLHGGQGHAAPSGCHPQGRSPTTGCCAPASKGFLFSPEPPKGPSKAPKRLFGTPMARKQSGSVGVHKGLKTTSRGKARR